MPPARLPKWIWLVAFALIIVSLLSVADWVYWREYDSIRTEKVDDLRSISKLKSTGILEWRRERISDATTESHDPFLRFAIAEWIHNPTKRLRDEILEQLEGAFHSRNYNNALLTDAFGNILFSIKSKPQAIEHISKELIAQSWSTRQTIFGDFARDKTSKDIYIDVISPILNDQQKPIAALVLSINPHAYLYPFIESWPTNSRTAETLLVQKEGEDALFLNPVRHAPNTALTMRIPLYRANVPAVQAALGETGTFEGKDYRGVTVLANIRKLQGTPWIMVAKIDRNELLGDVRYWRDAVVIMTLLMMIVAAGGTALLYTHHDRMLYRAYYQIEKDRSTVLEEIRATLYHIGDGVIATDIQGCVTRMNPEAEKLTGWSEGGAIGKPLQDVFQIINETTRAWVDNPASTVLREGVVVGLANHTTLIASDGKERPIADSGAPIRDKDGAITGVVLVFRDQTEERRRQSELLASERRYHDLFDEAPIALLEIDLTRITNHLMNLERSGISDLLSYFKERPEESKRCETMMELLNVNSAALKLFGVSGIEEIIENTERLFTQDLHEIFTEAMFALRQGSHMFQKDGTCRHINGDVIPIAVFINGWDERVADFSRVVVALTDLTIFRQAETAKEENRRLFLQLFTESIAPQLLIDLSSARIVDANSAASIFYGYSIDQLKERKITEINTSPEIDVLNRIELSAQKKENHFQARHRLASGDIREVEVFTSPIQHGGKTVLCSIIHDITERKHLQDHNRWLASLVEEGMNEVYAFDPITLHFTYANSAALENLGYGHDEIVELTPLDIKPEYTPETFKEMLTPLHSGEKDSISIETIHCRKDDSTYNILLTIQKLPLGEKETFVAIGLNITSHKRLEDQLRQSQKMESVGRLAGGVAHDFNNMLGVILGHAEMALDRIDTGYSVHDHLREILKATQRSADLTRQLLAFARRQTISPVILDMNEAVVGMLKMLRRLIGEDIELIWKPGHSLWSIKFDPAQVDQILMNLMVNARDAIDAEGTVTIETENVVFDQDFSQSHAGAFPGEYVLLAVSDTGVGMNKEILNHIFEPFFSTKEVGKGTGLGLAMIYGIVKQNKGYLTVYSEPGDGSCFKIYLPRCGETKRDIAHETPRKTVEGDETILLVEDEEAILNLGKAILNQQGYTVLSASNTIDAISLATNCNGTMHLLVTDIVMPEINGKKLADRISSIRPGIKVLLMSGYTASAIERHGVIEEGMHYLQKPFSIRTFAEKVRETLDS